VRLKLGLPGEALVDAEAAVRDDPLYLKAHERRTVALLGLGKAWRARQAYREAEFAFKDSQAHSAELAYVRSKLRGLAAQCEAEDRKGPVESREHWDEIARYMPTKVEPRIRLALMATWWNLSSQDERLTIFKRFLAVITGNEEAALEAQFAAVRAQSMVPLPMENYADLTVPAAWTDFYSQSSDKLVLFQNMYGSCNEQEKNLIARDLKEFFPPPAR
jgi:tetratricopeptide (TPR) repeat protein